MHYLLFYTITDDYITRRPAFRKAHLEYALKAVAHDALILGGAFANPPDGAVLLFRVDSPAVAGNFAKDDPYVNNGVAKSWRAREWTTVVRLDAAIVIDPATL
jgi:uncharacterized protein